MGKARSNLFHFNVNLIVIFYSMIYHFFLLFDIAASDSRLASHYGGFVAEYVAQYPWFSKVPLAMKEVWYQEWAVKKILDACFSFNFNFLLPYMS